jgi:hypothetical protein
VILGDGIFHLFKKFLIRRRQMSFVVWLYVRAGKKINWFGLARRGISLYKVHIIWLRGMWMLKMGVAHPMNMSRLYGERYGV